MKLITGLLLFALGIYFFTSSMADLMRFALGFPCLAAGFLMIVNATKKRKPPQLTARTQQGSHGRRRDGGDGNGHSDPDGAADSDGGGAGSGGDGGD